MGLREAHPVSGPLHIWLLELFLSLPFVAFEPQRKKFTFSKLWVWLSGMALA